MQNDILISMMISEQVNPFVIVTKSLFDKYLGVPIKKGPLMVERGEYLAHDLAIGIELTGLVSGYVAIEMREETVTNIVSELLDQNILIMDERVKRSMYQVGENVMVFGQKLMDKLGHYCKVKQPRVIINSKIDDEEFNQKRWRVPLSTKYGTIIVLFSGHLTKCVMNYS